MKDNKSVSKNKNQKKVRNDMKDIITLRKISDKEAIKIRCKCQHTREDGSHALFRTNEKSPFTERPLFHCEMCHAYVDIGTVDEEDLKRSIDTISRTIDIIKLRLKPDQNEEDHETYKLLWKFQFSLENGKILDLYHAAIRRNKNTRRNRNNDGFTIGAPRSHR